jgi:hypothetical protein
MGLNITWWLKNLFHLETIFVIAVIIATIYFIITTRKKKVESGEHDDEKEDNGSIPDFFNLKNGTDKVKTPKKKKKINKNEERCRTIFQEIFGVQFKSIRPDWLENPASRKNGKKGKNLEIDGFNANIITPKGKGLGFEYNGRQHAEYVPYFHRRGPGEFKYQRAKDSYKHAKSAERGILLIDIPELAPHDLERYIKTRLRKEGMGQYVDGKKSIYD